MSAKQTIDLVSLNHKLAKSLRSIHTNADPYRQGDRMLRCIHPLDQYQTTGDSSKAHYCRCPCCLLCRRQKASEERSVLLRLLGEALHANPKPIVIFANFCLQDCTPAAVKTHACLLVQACAKLLRKPTLKYNIGWTRTIETKSSQVDKDLENTHLHLILLFPPAWATDVGAIDWNSLWSECAGTLARSAVVSVARTSEAVAKYLTKNQAIDFVLDALVGIADPFRYWQRVTTGHAKFSNGGLLKLKVFTEADKLTGIAGVLPRASIRRRLRNPGKGEHFEPIPTEPGA